MLKNKLLLMMANFLHGATSAQDFSYDFPEELASLSERLEREDTGFAQLIDEMPEICASFDPYSTGEPDTLDEDAFRDRVREVYVQAITGSRRKVS